jgi:hypothetical protein
VPTRSVLPLEAGRADFGTRGGRELLGACAEYG